MAGVFRRKSDKARGKRGKWTAWWTDISGKQRSRAAYTDKAASLELANHLEREAARVREGIMDPGEQVRREAKFRPLADHLADYRAALLDRGGTPKHADHATGAIGRLLADASVVSVAELAPDRIQAALGRLKTRRSARTCNHAIGAVKAFARWLLHAGRTKDVPPGLLAIPPYNEEADRKWVRRALTEAELARLLAAAEAGPPVQLSRRGRPFVAISGPERAALYRLAMGTGFRADELRTLTAERFHLDDDAPTITVLACYAKNGKEAVQPITRELAEWFRPFLAGKGSGQPVLPVPEKTAKLLRRDLAAAGILYKDARGHVIDFHALRGSYITHLIRRGVNPKIVQMLARHSTITLTLDRYCRLDDDDVRDALEGKG